MMLQINHPSAPPVILVMVIVMIILGIRHLVHNRCPLCQGKGKVQVYSEADEQDCPACKQSDVKRK